MNGTGGGGAGKLDTGGNGGSGVVILRILRPASSGTSTTDYNIINVGGDETIGNGFSFETYLKPSQVSENRTIISLGNDDTNKLELTTESTTTL